MNWNHYLEVGSWIAGIGSFMLALWYFKNKRSSIKQKNKEGLNSLEVRSDKEIDTIQQTNVKGDNKVSL